MRSIHTGLEEGWDGYDKMAAYLVERARGGFGLIVAGGMAPSLIRSAFEGGAKLSARKEAVNQRLITEAVHKEGGKIELGLEEIRTA